MASNGQLGLGLTGDQVSPIQVSSSITTVLTAVYSLATPSKLHLSWQIVKWPRPTSKTHYTGEEQEIPFVGVVACGARHSCAVDRLGRLYTWGGSGGCMLGIPTDLAVDVSAVRHTSVR